MVNYWKLRRVFQHIRSKKKLYQIKLYNTITNINPQFFDIVKIEIYSLKEAIQLMNEIVQKNGDLVSLMYLRKNNYWSLHAWVKKYPQEFASYIINLSNKVSPEEKQRRLDEKLKLKEQRKLERFNKRLNKYLEIAKSLYNIHGNMPKPIWLRKNGYNRFYIFYKKYNSYFIDFPIQVKSKSIPKSIENWVKFAEELAQKNNGYLLPANTLKELGGNYTTLYKHMKLDKCAFSHIPRKDRKGNILKGFRNYDKPIQ